MLFVETNVAVAGNTLVDADVIANAHSTALAVDGLREAVSAAALVGSEGQLANVISGGYVQVSMTETVFLPVYAASEKTLHDLILCGTENQVRLKNDSWEAGVVRSATGFLSSGYALAFTDNGDSPSSVNQAEVDLLYASRLFESADVTDTQTEVWLIATQRALGKNQEALDRLGALLQAGPKALAYVKGARTGSAGPAGEAAELLSAVLADYEACQSSSAITTKGVDSV